MNSNLFHLRLRDSCLFCIAFFVFLTANALRAQSESTIRIRVLDSKTGLPFAKNDLHFVFWAGKNSPDSTVFAYDAILTGSQTGMGLGEVTIPAEMHFVRAFINYRSSWGLVSCDFRKDHPGPIPVYSVSRILASGIAAPNLCSSKTATARPGEFILFARNLTVWEKAMGP